MNIERMKRGYCEELYTNTCENFDKITSTKRQFIKTDKEVESED